MQALLDWGFGPDFLRQLDPSAFSTDGPTVGRVVTTSHGRLLLACGARLRPAVIAGRLSEEPLVGDWVVYRPSEVDGPLLVTRTLDRRSLLERRDPDTGRQGLAANVDLVFAVQPLDQDPHLRRLERTLTAIGQSGAEAAVLLTKLDLCPDPAAATEAVRGLGAPVLAVRALDDPARTRALLAPWCEPGKTLALLGASGVGKSTLVNALLGEERQATASVRASDQKGRHTTTDRQLLRLPGGGLVLDSPGLRELGLVDGEAGLESAFADVVALFDRCRWRDCAHGGEPGCAVAEAIDRGRLSPERWASYQKLLREIRHEETRLFADAARDEKDRWKRIHQQARARMAHRDRQRW